MFADAYSGIFTQDLSTEANSLVWRAEILPHGAQLGSLQRVQQ